MSYIKKIVRYFFHHEFSEEMVGKVQQRLLQKEDRQEKEEALREVWEEIGFPAVSENSTAQAFEQLNGRLGRSNPAERKRRRREKAVPLWMKGVAIYILPLLMLSFAAYFYREAKINGVADASLIEYFVPAGKRGMVVLPDSSRVWLNSGSLFIYPSSFKGEMREVYLSGEGYFEVEKQAERPFVVKSRLLDVEVTGTCFDLAAYPESERITTTLEQGAVRVRLKDTEEKMYGLTPDEQLTYNVHTGRVEVKHVVSADYSDWREGGLFFDNHSLKEIISILERTYGIRVHLKTSVYNGNRLTIHFNKNESIENVLMLLKELIPGMNYQITGKDIYLE